ncbi:MAG: hypothetical protein U9M90_04615 [Patescibacteria group bacterium]|nr:hypothetical protein [Patescibacteria group bacterium]
MKQKTRKLLSRIGAALMLGMSLFNLGAVWSKQRGGKMPYRVRNIRKKHTEKVDSETQYVADIAEKEAQIVLALEQKQQEESTQQLQEELGAMLQKIIRYAAISTWIFSASVIFSSAIFNYPFALGKGIMSIFPGVPHVAELSLQTEKKYYKVNEQASIAVYLDTNNEQVDLVKLTIRYDPSFLAFNDYVIDQKYFDSLEKRTINKDQGLICLSFRNSDGGIAIVKSEVAMFHFDTLQEAKTCGVSIEKSESAVIKHNTGANNILGKTSSASFRIVD